MPTSIRNCVINVFCKTMFLCALEKVMQNWTVASVTSASTLENLAIVRPLSKDATIEQLRDLFPDTADIVIAQPKGFARLANRVLIKLF